MEQIHRFSLFIHLDKLHLDNISYDIRKVSEEKIEIYLDRDKKEQSFVNTSELDIIKNLNSSKKENNVHLTFYTKNPEFGDSERLLLDYYSIALQKAQSDNSKYVKMLTELRIKCGLLEDNDN